MKHMVVNGFGPEGWRTYETRIDSKGVTWIPTSQPSQGFLIPGFVDLHIHGAYGVDFMTASKQDMEDLADRLRQDGYDGFYPTTVTSSPEAITSALNNLPENEAILGFHLEGPFVSPEYPGAQPEEFIIDWQPGSQWDAVLNDHRLKRITIAPERPGALSLANNLYKRGVQVSMGHTNATFQEAQLGFDSGVCHATHTFNAMRGIHHREVGALGAALLKDDVCTELVYDRHHVSKEAAQLLLKCKPQNNVVAVSDCTMAKGLMPGTEISMWGHECVVAEDSVRLKSNNALAGSACTLLDSFRRIAEDFGVETATRLCSINPRKAANFTRPVKVWTYFSSQLDLIETFHVIS